MRIVSNAVSVRRRLLSAVPTIVGTNDRAPVIPYTGFIPKPVNDTATSPRIANDDNPLPQPAGELEIA